MKKHAGRRALRWGRAVIAGFCLLATMCAGDDTNSPAIPTYDQLLERQAATLRAVEAARAEAEVIAKRNAEAVEARLQQMEQDAKTVRQRELEAIQNSHRFTLTLVGLFAGVGFLGLLCVTVLLVRALNRRTSIVSNLPVPVGYGPLALGPGDALVPPFGSVEQSRTMFLSAVDRLEKRIRELELGGANGKHDESSLDSAPVATPEPAAPPSGALGARARVTLLLGKGQALLNLDQADKALACFEEALTVDSSNPEVFVKKGVALEKLGRLDDALQQYDQAISLDGSLTMAYLRKGGVFNRMERYGEAVACYEQALGAQKKAGVA